MSKQDFNVLLMISKRGFRHTPSEQRFLSTQLDWVYNYNEKKLAGIARSLMSSTMSQLLGMDRSKRPTMPLTNVMLSNDGNGIYVVSEQLSIDTKFDVVIMKATQSERNELLSITSGEKTTTKPSVLATYFNEIAISELNSKIATGTSFSDLMVNLSNLIKGTDEWLTPLYMTYDNSLEKHEFSITFMTNEPSSSYVLRISATIS